MATDVLAADEEEELPPAANSEEVERNEQPEETRDGQRISHATQDELHSIRDGHMSGLKKTMGICRCDDCMSGLNALDPDGDGDTDIIPSLDYDNDGGAGGDGSGNGSPMYLTAKADIERMVAGTINATLKPIIQRFNAIGASQMQMNTTTHSDAEITRRMQEMDSRNRDELTNVHSVLTEVKGLVERIAATPQQGAVVVNSAAMRQQNQAGQPDIAGLISEISRAGNLTMDQQIKLATLGQKYGVIGQ